MILREKVGEVLNISPLSSSKRLIKGGAILVNEQIVRDVNFKIRDNDVIRKITKQEIDKINEMGISREEYYSNMICYSDIIK